MTIVDLISNEAGPDRRRLLLAATVAGASNALILALINKVAGSPQSAGLGIFAMFGLAVLTYVIGVRHTYHRTTYFIETALHRIRTRLVAKVEKTGFQHLERIGNAEIMDRLTENMAVVSESGGHVSHILQSLSILVFATLYIATKSPPAFALVVLIVAAGMSLFISKKMEVNAFLQQSAQIRLKFFELLSDLLRGFKEVKFSQRRGRDLRQDITNASDNLRSATMKAEALFDDSVIFANCNLYAALASLVFVLPHHVNLEPKLLTMIVTAVMFSWSSVGGIVIGYPLYLRSNQALENIRILEEKLDAAEQDESNTIDQAGPWSAPFNSIEARAIEYRYITDDASTPFHVGPIDLTITAGEVVFIVGGNGSGKSTFLKVLTGLYQPTRGTLKVDGIQVTPENVAWFRERISAIYSDFHLFSKLYGLLSIDEASVRRLLAQMQIEDKTTFTDQGFTNRHLSTGQRKRLALIITLLENRPIYIFDEWAADQDPEFRKYFYDELIPMLKLQGKTVIAVSHDDRYFRCADRVITMEYGAIRSIETMTPGTSPTHDKTSAA
ncbi:cyclic peptide export ABC transporter [Chondromyces crocatus]|uniref:ABC transporter ATP-binding protein n=1 Tax=Chondromyces crocatus TaxID=52 RepID=A0A0K1ES22_CHOCO|nr:cyclic peptide export ABC transporter [Chondromyces crocatus]AKT43457.1 ABC transporter ATP-binding protein [Chondromyces crocatus]